MDDEFFWGEPTVKMIVLGAPAPFDLSDVGVAEPPVDRWDPSLGRFDAPTRTLRKPSR